MSNIKVGIIGGSGLDNQEILREKKEKEVTTPYGLPSSPLTIGKIKGIDVVILARHGKKHIIPPTNVNYRANIYALKQEGCTYIIATTAVGSLKKEIKRGDLVIIDQFIDFTRQRKTTFHESFENGPVHTPMAEPFDKLLREKIIETIKELKFPFHENGTVVTIEGPRFSTRAESRMFQSWGADIINMSIAPEATLANELKIPYAAIAMSTDYDSWNLEENPVTWENILKIFSSNVKKVTDLIINVIPKLNSV